MKQFFRGLAMLGIAGSLLFGPQKEMEPNQTDVSFQVKESIVDDNLLEKRISGMESLPNNLPDKYALLITGRNELRFGLEVKEIYETLLDCGFPKDNIFILDQNGEKIIYPTDGIATKVSLSRVISYLKGIVDKNDLFLMHISDHGVKIGLDSGIVLADSMISGADFAEMLNGVNPGVGIVTVDSCFGGGIAEKVGKGRFVAISASGEDEFSWSDNSHSFCRVFYRAFKRKNEADYNRDFKITLNEAFRYANENFKKGGILNSNPQIVSDIDISSIGIR